MVLKLLKTALQTEYDLNPTIKTSVKYKNADSEKQTAYTDELTKAEEFWTIRLLRKYRSTKFLLAWQQPKKI